MGHPLPCAEAQTEGAAGVIFQGFLVKEKGETQVQVGIKTGVGERNYQRLEAGENFPSVETLCALADHFEVSLDYLMGRTDQR